MLESVLQEWVYMYDFDLEYNVWLIYHAPTLFQLSRNKVINQILNGQIDLPLNVLEYIACSFVWKFSLF